MKTAIKRLLLASFFFAACSRSEDPCGSKPEPEQPEKDAPSPG